MSQTYDVTMTEEQRQTLLLVVDESDAAGGTKGARRQGRGATALEKFKPLGGEAVITKLTAVVVRLTYENVEVILESSDRACRPTLVQGQEVRPAILKVRGVRVIDSIIGALEKIKAGEAAEGVEVVGLNGTGKAETEAGEAEEG